MTDSVLSGKQFAAPITEGEARGNSRPVSGDEFQDLARRGHERLQALSEDSGRGGTRGLDKNWDSIVPHAYAESQKSWGGVTVNASTGKALQGNEDKYALTVRHPGQPNIRLSEHATPEEFGHAMNQARQSFPQLSAAQHHLGVFHDDDEHAIDIDPVVVVDKPQHVEEIGAYSHAVGGAYHFKTGDGYFPPHVKGT